MSADPPVVVGLPLYNGAEYVDEAIESLRAQTFCDFALVIVDDASTDRGPETAKRHAASDERIVLYLNPKRLGLIGNWRRAFELGRELHPRAKYFAWAGDHDRWHPDWLQSLVQELDDQSDAVLAYPLTQRVSATGEPTETPWTFETRYDRAGLARFYRTTRRMVAGDMVYGLFDASALERAGVLHRVLMPDRLLLATLSLQGRFLQVPRVLWWRRMFGQPDHRRQRQTLFERRNPLHSYVPWLYSHAAVLAWTIGDHKHLALPRGHGLAATLIYLGSFTMMAAAGRVSRMITAPFRSLSRGARRASSS